MKPDKIEIVAVKNACRITAYAGETIICSDVLEYVGGETYSGNSPVFRAELPIELALTLEDLQLNLMDAMLALNTSDDAKTAIAAKNYGTVHVGSIAGYD